MTASILEIEFNVVDIFVETRNLEQIKNGGAKNEERSTSQEGDVCQGDTDWTNAIELEIKYGGICSFKVSPVITGSVHIFKFRTDGVFLNTHVDRPMKMFGGHRVRWGRKPFVGFDAFHDLFLY
jgi:hypothetical protein